MSNEMNRRRFLKLAGTAAFAMSAAGLLASCDDAPASSTNPDSSGASSGASSGSASSGAGSTAGSTETTQPKPGVEQSYTVSGTEVYSETFRRVFNDKVYYTIGSKTIRVLSNRTNISIIDGKTYTQKIQGVETYTLSNGVTKVKRLGTGLYDSTIFYVPEGTVVSRSWQEDGFSGNEIQWCKTSKLKSNDELTKLGDRGKLSSAASVRITSGGLYQLCCINEEDSYAVAGNIVLSVE